jgi:hypothetical protein
MRCGRIEIHEPDRRVHVWLYTTHRNLNLRTDASPENAVSRLYVQSDSTSYRQIRSMQGLASILHSSDITSHTQNSFFIEAEKSADIDTEALSVDLGRKLTLRLSYEYIADDRKTRRPTLPAARHPALSMSQGWNE